MYNQGWECPKCGRVYSPSTSQCFACPATTRLTTTSNLVGGYLTYWRRSVRGPDDDSDGDSKE